MQQPSQRIRILHLIAALLSFVAGSAEAQVLIANDDGFGVPYGLPLVVEAFGVLENDILDDENAGESGATAELVSDVSHGTLALASDGSFSYSAGATFAGMDSFVYRARFGGVTATATVTLSACEGGPQLFTCWKEAAYLQTAAELGLFHFGEGFENDSVWGIARSPISAPSITSRGITWQSNHPDPPASNELTTGPGPALTGQYGLFDPEHGYAPDESLFCDNNENPPPGCFYHDGMTGTREAGLGALYGAGGYFTAIYGAKLVAILDGDESNPIGVGQLGTGHRFLGVIDARASGFTRFEFREIEGRAGNALYVWADDFTFLTATAPVIVPALSPPGVLAAVALLVAGGLVAIRRRA